MDDASSLPSTAGDTLHNEVTDALARGLITPAEVAGLSEAELVALYNLAAQARARGDHEAAVSMAASLVVLDPYRLAAWRLLAVALEATRALKQAQAAWAAVDALSPAPEPPSVAPSLSPETATALEACAPDDASALTLDDGRPLPLRTTAVALHHDTAAARQHAESLLAPEQRTQTLRWVQPVPMAAVPTEARSVTQTGIVARRRGRETLEPIASDSATETSIVGPLPPRMAAALRRGGWPLTDAYDADAEPTQGPQRG